MSRSAPKAFGLAVLLAGALGILAVLAAADGDALAKPARPAPPSWRALNAWQIAPARSLPRKKTPVKTGGWGAVTEPDATATVTPQAAVPVPSKKPVARTAVIPPVSILPKPVPEAATVPQKTVDRLSSEDRLAQEHALPLAPMDVVTTEVAGEEEKDKDKEKDKGEKAEQPALAAPIGDGPASKQYCANISTAAADARFAWQKKALLQTEQEVAKRVVELDQKIAEYQKWLARRDEFSRKAEAVVVNIYGKMKPDAAAQQLAILDEEIAAAVLTKLDARSASAVMNEMEPKRAARLTAIITGAAKGPGGKPPGATPPAPAPTEKDNGT